MARVTLLTGGNLGNREHNLAQAALLIGRQIGPVILSSALYESEPWGFEAEELFLNQALIAETTLTPMAVLERIHAIERSLGRERTVNVVPEPDGQSQPGSPFSADVANKHLYHEIQGYGQAVVTNANADTGCGATADGNNGRPLGTPDSQASHSNGAETEGSSERAYHSRTIDIDILFYDNIRLSTPRLVIPHPRIAERGFVLRPLAEIIPDYIHPATGHSIRYMWQQFCRKNAQQ